MTVKDFQSRGQLSIFASYYKPHLKLFLLDLSCALCISIIDLLFPWVSRLCMNRLLPQRLFGTFFAVMAVMALAYLLKGALYHTVTYWGHMMGGSTSRPICVVTSLSTCRPFPFPSLIKTVPASL